MNTLQQFEARQTEKHLENNNIPQFSAGDTIKVNVKIREGTRERVQAFEGVCIARSGTTGPNASFTVRKISLGEGVERVFPLFSPRIDSIEVMRHGDVRRAKLYYLRDRRGKSARITERTTGHGMDTEVKEDTSGMTQTAKRAAKKAEKDAKRAEGRAANDKIVADKKAAKAAAVKEAEAAAAAEAANSEGSAE